MALDRHQRLGQDHPAEDHQPGHLPVGRPVRRAGPDRRPAQRDQRHPPRADRAGERLPLRRRARHGPPDHPAAVRRDRRVRRAAATPSTARSSSTRWACRCASASPSPPSSSPTCSWSTRSSRSATPTSSRSASSASARSSGRAPPCSTSPMTWPRSRRRASGPCGWPTPWCRPPVPPRRWSPSTGPRSSRTPPWPRPPRVWSRSSRPRSSAADGGQIRSECDLDICLTLERPRGLRRQLLHRRVPGHRLPDVHRPLQRVLPGRRLRGPLPVAQRAPGQGRATRCGRPCPAT